MLKHYYQQELYKIRELAKEFAELYPMLAPLLGERGDPDVERLLEGFAFLIAQLQERIDKSLPRVYAGFAQMFYPQLLRPSPSATTIQFQPTANIGQSINVPQACQLQSVLIENQTCVFSTTQSLSVEPIILTRSYLDMDAYGHNYIALDFELMGVSLMDLKTSELILHLAGEWANATRLYCLLLTGVESVVFKAEGADDYSVKADALQIYQGAFDHNLHLKAGHAHDAFRLLQEYFVYPRKFLYVSLGQLDTWRNQSSAKNFTVCLYLNPAKTLPVNLDLTQIKLHCVTAINLMEAAAEPFVLDYRLEDYRIQASDKSTSYKQIFDIKAVVGYQQGLPKPVSYSRQFFEKVEGPHYELVYRQGPSIENWDYYISFDMPHDLTQKNYHQTISSHLWVCHGKLPEYLRLGEVNRPGFNTPERITFKNIDLPSRYFSPKMEDDFLWQVQGLLSFNYLPFLDVVRFKALLKLFLPRIEDQVLIKNVNLKIAQGIEQLTVEPCERLVYGESITGCSISLTCNGNHFSGSGDLYLFGQLLWQFFTVNTPIGGFYTFRLINSALDELWTWEPSLLRTIRHKYQPAPLSMT